MQGPIAAGLGALVALGAPTSPGIQFRRIENGFLMTYTLVKEGPFHGGALMGQPLPLPAGAPEGLAAALSALPHVHRTEVFVKDAADALPHLTVAMASLEKLSKMSSGGFFM